MIKKSAYLNTDQIQQDYRGMLPVAKLEFAIGILMVVAMLVWFVWLATNPDYALGRITAVQPVSSKMVVAETKGPHGSDYLLAENYLLESLQGEWILANGERTQGQPSLLMPDNLAYPTAFNHIAYAVFQHHPLVQQYVPFVLVIIGALLLIAGRVVFTSIYVLALSSVVLFIGWHVCLVAEWNGYLKLNAAGTSAVLIVLGLLIGRWSLMNLRLQIGNSLVAGLLWIVFSDVLLKSYGLEDSKVALLLLFGIILFLPQFMVAIISCWCFSHALNANIAASYVLLGLSIIFVLPRILEDGSAGMIRKGVMLSRGRLSATRKGSPAELLERD
jgi:hypothetical protein